MLKLAKRMSFWAVAGAILFMIVQVVSDLYLPTLTSDIINNGVAKGDVDYIWSVGLKMLGFSLISIAAATGNVFLAARQSQKLGKTLRSEVYKKVTNFTNDEFDEMGTSSLITRTTNDVVQVQNVVMMFLRMMIMAPIMLIGASFLAYSKDGELTKIFLYVLPILAVFMGVIMYFAVPLFKSMQKKTDKLNLVFREGLTGIRVIRAFNRSKSEAVRFDEANKDFTDTSIKVNTIMSFMLPVMTFVMSATNIAIIWYGGHYIADGTLEVGNLIAFMTYAMQILMSFMMLSMVFVFIPRGQASAVRINEVLNMESKINDPKVITKMPAENRGTLDFNHVDFRYEGAERLALKDIDFHGRNGQTVAIIGGTGSGKSSLSNLIPRFYDVESGSIEINGIDIRQMSQHELRDAVGFVPQKAMLFTGTIRENIQYGKKDATDEEIWHALEIAQSKEFVEELPDGLDSYVEQGGGNFSGGQKQRLCIARALIKKADIFVFDDSFSALDFKTDAALRKALKPETKEAVVVIVAQRISTVVDADLILVLDEGELVGMGTHEELKETNATYQEIISSQLREEEI
ncbi:ABC transporter ATP-binding protein [Carnobacterium divergens]|uniref:ABC transporter, ATP-binding permease protein n=2 Tax=Carnobacterium divergens TaxID=2748 RepID=A0A0R2I4D9_CARDV|nr:ABC transporter ATP-binding protein [Carnobacterium divergens]KRN57269.1 ABC transporter, ATP-binding permease protein [Carnobacterium divergens DSM 20623]MDO0875409.1 ABC transporter ATP-binding protein/permease [Carnobacterium divergens]MDT1957767.1 ABC transporter ATP-binding protein/permease [Carnobacterium divergens]MDT1973395.1 ABC transporter ATP-binding protein/permease [Carnobacterium divergens]MDT2011649.1 ABC transporter ATP-binding protein/permease [Carnobacterium divergens]